MNLLVCIFLALAQGAPGPLVFRDLNQFDPFPMNSGDRLSNTLFFNGTASGYNHVQTAGPCTDVVVENCAFLWFTKWASRTYRQRGPITFRDVTFTGVKTEHGYYGNMAGWGTNQPPGARLRVALLFERCLFEDIGSQAIQIVGPESRPEETPDLAEDATQGGLIWVKNCRVDNAGFNRGGNARVGYSLSFFWSQNDVLVSGTRVDHTRQRYSNGALLIEGPPGWAEPAYDWDRDAVVSRCSFKLGVADRPTAQFKDVDELRLDRSHFEARPGTTEKNEPGRQTIELIRIRKLTITGCTGNVRVHRDGQDIGPIQGLEIAE